jgi:hypothetical protein
VKNSARCLSVAILSILLVACAGAGRAFRIEGAAPESGACRVEVVRAGTTQLLFTHEVSGAFTVTPPPAELGTANVDVMAICGGRTVMKVANVAPAFYWEKPLTLGDF